MASEGKTRPMKKALRRNISTQHKAEPSKITLRNMIARGKVSLLPVAVGVSGGWVLLSRMLYRKDLFPGRSASAFKI